MCYAAGMAEHTDPQHVANVASLAIDLADLLAEVEVTADMVADLPEHTWVLAYRIVRGDGLNEGPALTRRAAIRRGRAPSLTTQQTVQRLMARREAEAGADPFRGFPQ